MKLQITLDTDLFDVNVSQDGDIASAREARMMNALMSQTFQPLIQSVTDLHMKLKAQEDEARAKEQAEFTPLAKD